MAKRTKATKEKIKHGLEGSDTWLIDQLINKRKSKDKVWVLVDNPKHTVFKSDVSALRAVNQRGKESRWGYQVSETPYSKLINCNGSEYEHYLSKTFDELTSYHEISLRKNKADQKKYPQVQNRKAKKNESFMERVTIDVSPEISRGLQIYLENIDERPSNDSVPPLMELQLDLDYDLSKIVDKFEELHQGAKVVGAAWHVLSGQLHVDLWVHSCYEKEVKIGKKKTKKKLRLRDPNALHHYGPGSGIVAWNRHIKVLGNEAEKVAPATLNGVQNAIKSAEQKAVKMNRPDTANRDIQMHEYIDSIIGKRVEPESLKVATEQYRDHLRTAYQTADEYALGIDAQWHEQVEQQQILNELEATNLQESREIIENQALLLDATQEMEAEELQAKRNQLAIDEANLLLRESSLYLQEDEAKQKQFELREKELQIAVKESELQERTRKRNEEFLYINNQFKQLLRSREINISMQDHKIRSFNRLAPLVKKLLPALKDVEKKLKPVLSRFGVSFNIIAKIEEALVIGTGSVSKKTSLSDYFPPFRGHSEESPENDRLKNRDFE